MSKIKTPAIIFAGGKSSRMGKDKALLPFKGFATLTQFQYHRLLDIFEDVYISTKKEKFDFKAPFILDTYEISSPLIALISIFEILEAEEIFILSVDTPFIDRGVIEKLFSQNQREYDTIIAHSVDGIEPLCGIYKKTILPYAYAQLKQRNHKLRYLLKSLKTKVIRFEEKKIFTNLNYYAEYEKVKKEE